MPFLCLYKNNNVLYGGILKMSFYCIGVVSKCTTFCVGMKKCILASPYILVLMFLKLNEFNMLELVEINYCFQ